MKFCRPRVIDGSYRISLPIHDYKCRTYLPYVNLEIRYFIYRSLHNDDI